MTQKLNKNGKPRAPANSIRIQGLSLEQIAEQSGKHVTTIYKRYLSGLSDEEIIHGKTNNKTKKTKPEPPQKPTKELMTVEGKTIAEIAKITDMKECTIRTRLKSGWTLEKIMTTPVNLNMSRTQERATNKYIHIPWEPDPTIQAIAQTMNPTARLFCGVIHIQ